MTDGLPIFHKDHPWVTHPAINQALCCLTSNIGQTHYRIAVKASSYKAVIRDWSDVN